MHWGVCSSADPAVGFGIQKEDSRPDFTGYGTDDIDIFVDNDFCVLEHGILVHIFRDIPTVHLLDAPARCEVNIQKITLG